MTSLRFLMPATNDLDTELKLPEESVPRYAGLIGLFVITTLLLRDFAFSNPFQGYDYLIVLVAAGALVLSRTSFATIGAAASFGWLFNQLGVEDTKPFFSIVFLVGSSVLRSAFKRFGDEHCSSLKRDVKPH